MTSDIKLASVFDTTSPDAQGDCLKYGWLGQVMGVPPPARISRDRPPCVTPYGELGLDGSILRQFSWRNSLPQTAFGSDGTAGHLIWPSLMQTWSAQVVLAHLPLSLAFWRCRERVQDRICNFQRAERRFFFSRPYLKISG